MAERPGHRPDFAAYVKEFFEASLLLSLLTSLVGVAVAAVGGPVKPGYAALSVLGTILVQASVNLVNDYFDFSSGIDQETVKTPFSGGSKLLVSGRVSPRGVLTLGLATAAAAAGIGIYLALVVSLYLFLLAAFGGIAIILYSRVIVRVPMAAEPFVMLSFILEGIGCYIVAHGGVSGLALAAFVIVPAGMLGGITLLVNEVPDTPVDAKHGRRHAVVLLGTMRKVSGYYLALMATTYVVLLAGVFTGAIPSRFLTGLLTLPIALYVALGILRYSGPQGYERTMATQAGGVVLYLGLLVAGAML